MLVVNKVDSAEKRFDTFQFYSLGLGDPWDISSANGSGTGDMLDELVKLLRLVSLWTTRGFLIIRNS